MRAPTMMLVTMLPMPRKLIKKLQVMERRKQNQKRSKNRKKARFKVVLTQSMQSRKRVKSVK